MSSRRSGSVVRPLVAAAVAAAAAGCAILGYDFGGVSLASDGSSPDSDGGSDADAATWCTTALPPAAFCDDFDHEPITALWDNPNRTPDIGVSSSGTITADPSQKISAPQSARLAVPPLIDQTQEASGILYLFVHDVQPDLTIEFEVRIDTEDFPPNSRLGIATMLYEDAGSIDLVRRASSTGLFAPSGTMTLTKPLVVGQWTVLQLTIKNRPTDGGAGGLATLYMDGAESASVPLPVTFQTVTEQILTIGPIGAGPVGAFVMNVDNVRVWRRSDL
jgi:hypothetical protein